MNPGPKVKPPLQQVADAVFSDSTLTPTVKLIALCVGWHMNRASLTAFPSDALIAWETGFSTRTVRAVVPSLAKARLVVTSRGGSMRGGKRESTRYRLVTAEAASTVKARTTERRSTVKGGRLRNYVPTTAEPASTDCGTTFHLTNEVNQGTDNQGLDSRRVDDIRRRVDLNRAAASMNAKSAEIMAVIRG